MSSISRPTKHPLITILGSTGTGKSELAVSLARKLNGEVINGDALQLYQGLPIVTNKITPAEQHGVRHHLLGTIPLTESTWTVSRFTGEVERIIEGIRNRGRIPILVGGTHYYLQSTLFTDALVTNDIEATSDNESEAATVQQDSVTDDGTFMTAAEQEAKWPILKASPEEIREELLRVDPVMAARWHPKDSRKIRRSLIIYLQTGRQASEIYNEQAQNRQRLTSQASGHELASSEDSQTVEIFSSTLRYDNLLLWTYTETKALDARLFNRVEKMVERGLLDEIKQMNYFKTSQEQLGHSVDSTRGIWVAIGYKEFAQYLEEVNRPVSDQVDRDIDAALLQGKERTFFATRQYARYQLRWIRRKLLPSLDAAGIRDKIFLLDSTNLDLFPSEVEDKAADLVSRWLSGRTLPKPEHVSALAGEVLGGLGVQESRERSPRTCEMCGLTIMTEYDWEKHVRSSKHKRAKKRLLELARNPRYAAAVAHRREGDEGKAHAQAEHDGSDSEVVG